MVNIQVSAQFDYFLCLNLLHLFLKNSFVLTVFFGIYYQACMWRENEQKKKWAASVVMEKKENEWLFSSPFSSPQMNLFCCLMIYCLERHILFLLRFFAPRSWRLSRIKDAVFSLLSSTHVALNQLFLLAKQFQGL